MKLFALITLLIGSFVSVAECGDTEFKPFPMAWTDNSDCLIDLSFLLDAPAGKDGFITIRNGHLTKPDGSRFRIWGVNVTAAACFPSKDDAPAVADHLARFGINCVRFHFLDSNWSSSVFLKGADNTRSFDQAQLDRFDYFVAELKKRGIYTNINLNVGRNYRKADGVADYQSIGLAKAITHFDDRLIELQKEYATQLLTHVNPYTKTTYANEPAVPVVEIVNENSLVEAWFSGRLLGNHTGGPGGTWQDTTRHYADLLTEKYNAWLKKRLNASQLDTLRRIAGVGAADLVPRLAPDEFSDAPDRRFHTEAAFYMHVEDTFFQSIYNHLKKTVGTRSLVVGTSDHNHWKSGYPLLTSTAKLDIVDGHVYWQHPSYSNDPKTGKGTFSIKNTPMVNDPLYSTIVQLSRSAVAGKPYTVSETNHPFPSEYACEGIPILAAYAAFQDWDGIFLYTFEHSDPTQWQNRAIAHFDIRPDPVRMTNIAAGALMFLRADIQPARETILRTYSLEHIRQSIRQSSNSNHPYFTPGFHASTPLIHSTRISSFDAGLKSYPEMPSDDTITSDTDQLKWHHDAGRKGIVTIDTPRTQALIGFVKANDIQLPNLSADIENDFCSIILSSCDGRPIAESRRLLLAITARSANTGMKWNSNRTSLEKWGTTPVLIEPIKGLITLNNLQSASELEAIPLNSAAKPLNPRPDIKTSRKSVKITVGDAPTTWYLIRPRQ